MWRIVLVGGAGGMLPSLVDKVEAWNAGVIGIWLTTAPNIWLAILVAVVPLLLYFLIGAFIAAIYENENLQKALLLGIGAPAFIVASVSGTGNQTTKIDVGSARVSVLGFIQPAYAQTAPPAAGAPPQVELDVGKAISVPGCDTCNVTFFGTDRQPIATRPFASASSGTIKVPPGVAIIEFDGMDANAAELDLGDIYKYQRPASGTVKLDVGVDRSLHNDFLRSLGVKGVQPYNFDVQVQRW